MSGEALEQMLTEYRTKREQDQATLEAMVFYAQSGLCRWRVLLADLEGEAAGERCGRCDNCRRIALHSALDQRLGEIAAKDPAAPLRSSPPRRRLRQTAPVRVKRYGFGQVVSSEASAVQIQFADGSRRTFHPDFIRAVRATGRGHAIKSDPTSSLEAQPVVVLAAAVPP